MTAEYDVWAPEEMTDEDLVATFSIAAAEITRRRKATGAILKGRFPRGHIRTLASCSERFSYLTLRRRRTIACMLQLCDVNRWHLDSWDLMLTAGATFEWFSCLPVIAVTEAVLYEYARQNSWVTVDVRFKKLIDTCQSKGAYGHPLRARLHEAREFRNGIHLQLHGEVEMHDGKPKRYNDAVTLLKDTEAAILRHWQKEA